MAVDRVNDMSELHYSVEEMATCYPRVSNSFMHLSYVHPCIPAFHDSTSECDILNFSVVTVSEAAIALLSPSTISPLAQRGGIFTPAFALGDSLVKALEENEKVEVICDEIADGR